MMVQKTRDRVPPVADSKPALRPVVFKALKLHGDTLDGFWRAPDPVPKRSWPLRSNAPPPLIAAGCGLRESIRDLS